MSLVRARWAALGAAVAVSLGAGGIGLVSAEIGSGDRPVTVAVAPERILDTRTDLGLSGAFVGEVPRDVQVTGEVPVASGGTATVVPTDAVAVLVNVTVVAPTSAGFLSLRPSGEVGKPSTSSVNFSAAGVVEPNAATVALGPGGKIQVYVLTAVPGGTADVLVDVVGYTIGHTHDDSYYTKNQMDTTITDIDSQISAVEGGLSAVESGLDDVMPRWIAKVDNGVNPTSRASDPAHSVVRLGAGNYRADFGDMDLSQCAWNAVLSTDVGLPAGFEIRTALDVTDPTRLVVRTSNSAGTAIDSGWQAHVYC